MSRPNNVLRLYDKRVEQLVTVARKPGGGVASVPVAELSKWNFKLLVQYVKICELRSRPVVLADINDNSLRSIEYHQNLVTLHENAEKSLPVITQTHITKNIALVWEIVNEHLEASYCTKGVSVLWRVLDTVSSKTIGLTLH